MRILKVIVLILMFSIISIIFVSANDDVVSRIADVNNIISEDSREKGMPSNFVYSKEEGGYIDTDSILTEEQKNNDAKEKMLWLEKWGTKEVISVEEWCQIHADSNNVIDRAVLETLKLQENIETLVTQEERLRSHYTQRPTVLKTFDPIFNVADDNLDLMEEWLRNSENELVSTAVRYVHSVKQKYIYSTIIGNLEDPTKYWVHQLDNAKLYCQGAIYDDINSIKDVSDTEERHNLYRAIIGNGYYAKGAILKGIADGVIPEESSIFVNRIDNILPSIEAYPKLQDPSALPVDAFSEYIDFELFDEVDEVFGF